MIDVARQQRAVIVFLHKRAFWVIANL